MHPHRHQSPDLRDGLVARHLHGLGDGVGKRSVGHDDVQTRHEHHFAVARLVDGHDVSGVAAEKLDMVETRYKKLGNAHCCAHRSPRLLLGGPSDHHATVSPYFPFSTRGAPSQPANRFSYGFRTVNGQKTNIFAQLCERNSTSNGRKTDTNSAQGASRLDRGGSLPGGRCSLPAPRLFLFPPAFDQTKAGRRVTRGHTHRPAAGPARFIAAPVTGGAIGNSFSAARFKPSKQPRRSFRHRLVLLLLRSPRLHVQERSEGFRAACAEKVSVWGSQ